MMKASRSGWTYGRLVGVAGLLCLLLTGCWDQRAINSRDIVTTIGVDPTSTHGEYRWAFVFPNPTTEPAGVGQTAGGPQVFTTTVRAQSFAGALASAQRANTRELYLGQIRMLVLSTRLPAREWYHIIDAVTRPGSIVETIWLVGARDGRTVASYVPPSEQVPEVGTYQALSCGCLPMNWGKRLWQLWAETETPGISPAVPVVDIHGSTFRFDRIAVLSPKAVTVWSQVASAGWAYLTDRAVRASVTIQAGHRVVWAVQDISGRAHVTLQNGSDGVTVRVLLHERGFLSDTPRDTAISPRSEWRIEEAVSRQILHLCGEAVSKARRTGTDPFGWHRDYRWGAASLGHKVWTEGWAHWHVHITVQFNLRGTGIMR